MATTADQAQLVALATAYQSQTIGLRAQLERQIRAVWKSLGEYRAPQQRSYVRDVVPLVLGAQQQMSSLETTFLAHQRQLALGGTFRPVPVKLKDVTGAQARLGVAPQDVHARPFNLVWRQLHELPRETGSIEKAIAAGENRGVELALDDVQLAKRGTAAKTGERDDQVKYVERLLEGPTSCGLCIVASTQRYHPGQLLPIHGGCDCGQVFRYADTDPGTILHLDRLQDVHSAIAERFGDASPSARAIPGTASNYQKALQYRDVLVTHEHGELGPVLGVRGHEFTGPSDLS